MNDTEQLLAAVEKTAHATPRWEKYPLPAALSTQDIAQAEATLGFALPPLLTALHTRIANGGFGPAYGLLPLTGDPAPDGEHSAVDQYLAHRRSASEEGQWPWPEGVLPICSLGCGMYSCVDCRTERTTVLLFEPNADEPQHAWYIDQPDLATWLRIWLDGAGWYGEDADDEAMDHLQPWPDYNTRI
ncbi:SMI1/KNR4 family protein [Streptomyces sp. NBC_00841]|uniref:SMI1/KNR4 family protein n=1 Tax=Streptomyces sp. NBC_00841 TaxID=2975847 RepID=UPI002DD9A237|nr:SMI1/KNR4 family protein [Streptomyces sp. NBC_00841]WSA01229.1 SMI1/KNR4 family protein [Streptomyces sp. NBC_00841]